MIDMQKIDLIKKLRQSTLISLNKCKIALEESNYDYENALKYVKTHYFDQLIHHQNDKTTNEGMIFIAENAGRAVMMQLMTQTDFASKNEHFTVIGNKIIDHALEMNISDLVQLDENVYIQEQLNCLRTLLAEKINITKFVLVSADIIGSYVHDNKIGCIVTLLQGDRNIAREIAIQIVGFKAQYLDRKLVPKQDIETMLASYQEEHKNKPTHILEKILDGKKNKLFSEIVLLDQPFYKFPEKTVKEYLEANNASIKDYIKFQF